MILHLYGDLDLVEAGIQELASIVKIEQSENGIPVQIVKRSGSLRVSLENGQGYIAFAEQHHFFRALGLFVEYAQEMGRFDRTEEPRFDFNGPMLDVSRNAVLKLETIKQMIRYMALMGLNGLMLYTEDTYEIPNRPYFGYMRGRYTTDELKELDDYAAQFGIEIVPCIQTLAHLASALKWPFASAMRDTNDILLVDEPQTYTFIEEMISAATAPFRSKRIHIGMDEAFGLGLGRYLERNGYRERFSIMNDHVSKVLDITQKYGLKPMIWSDMYFHFLSNDQHAFHYNLNVDFSQERLEQIPKDVQFVYWDYGNRDQSVHERIMNRHKEFGSVPLFAGGIHIWGSMSPNYGKTWMSTHPALLACKSEGIREVLATAWGDNGQETNHLVMLPGLQLFAEHGYSDDVTDAVLRTRFAACTGMDLFDDIVGLKEMDEVPGVEQGNHYMAKPSKYLLWQDILLGLFDKHVEGDAENTLPEHYAKLGNWWRTSKEKAAAPFDAIFGVYEKLSGVLASKATIGIEIMRLYRDDRKEDLRKIAEFRLPALHKQVDELRKAHSRLWMLTNKPYGWEVLDTRYGGLLARISSACQRLLDYTEGREGRLEELECERLPFDTEFSDRPLTLNVSGYHRIVSASSII
ncbi:beta-N-acetylhexosaminidase [Paenibacillus sp. LHD-38]|uniref:beta-N-acetylhexosaminidase n=1 Tax=Paenibacillus sp. LHD-38 TaxID=3072143 RepID=UPI00280D86B5|nr:beta-N-acetylhexosaminidase [Paenibacillus sp. LHD-38]MDQ8734517.1 beta-N-acetylhexosaminidase [Paenibacillus sp. LHD-38]